MVVDNIPTQCVNMNFESEIYLQLIEVCKQIQIQLHKYEYKYTNANIQIQVGTCFSMRSQLSADKTFIRDIDEPANFLICFKFSDFNIRWKIPMNSFLQIFKT